MDESRRYIEEEISRIDTEIKNTTDLIPELGREAEEEIERLNVQKEALKKALEASSGNETVGEEMVFKSVMIEVRQGVGGDEAKIWAEDLMRMYTRYAETKKWKMEILDEGVTKFSGKDVYKLLKFETGVHRVQRVPETEAAGRIHTSTASVILLPEVPEKVVEVREDDLIWEFTRGGGHGGQNVNKVATAVRLTHKPSGIVVQARQERSQEQNRKIALSLLRSELWEIEEEKKKTQLSDVRSQIGRSMRSEKIRTYNYPQNRVTDHRIGKSWYNLERIIEGELDEVIEAMKNYVPGQEVSVSDED